MTVFYFAENDRLSRVREAACFFMKKFGEKNE